MEINLSSLRAHDDSFLVCLYLLIFLYILLCATCAFYKLPLVDSAGTAERCPILIVACCVFHMRQIDLIVNLDDVDI